MIGTILYNIIIAPIEMIIEFIFSTVYLEIGNAGIAIVFVSLAINFLVLPLYKRSDAMQEQERDRQKAMKPWLDHIKKHFKGDERYMMTQTYYRQQGYKPIYALKGMMSLLLQIPFFIAAYHYLSNLDALKGTGFLFLNNLGDPDGLIRIGSLSINLLPVLMTVINLISGAIYTRGFAFKEKLTLYGTALIFLVLLYNSPSGLVFYWTLNNLFSLGKNIVMKLVKLPARKERPEPELIDKKIFILGAVFLSVFLGLYIPVCVIDASPLEFIGLNYGPLFLIINTFTIVLGFFVLWLSIFYFLGSNRAKNTFAYALWLISIVAVVDFFAYGGDLGNMNVYLVLDNEPKTGLAIKLINIAVLAASCLAGWFIMKKWKKIPKAVYSILIMVGVAYSVYTIFGIQKDVNAAAQQETEQQAEDEIEPIIPLSKDGKNVIVLMLDRAISPYVPIILERENLTEQFDGFTYYPNTVAYGRNTNHSAPSLFGGYEYTPVKLNERKDKTLPEKQDEADTLMPSIFNDADYTVTVCDPPYAGNYKMKPDISIYDKYENVTAHITKGAYMSSASREMLEGYEGMQKRNFVCYSIFRTLPVSVRGLFYDKGRYVSASSDSDMNKEFWEVYPVLQNLNNLTEIKESGNTFLMMVNDTTHEDTSVIPDYDIVPISTPSKRQRRSKRHYLVNAAALKHVGEWLDYMREQGVYDNTRIIICSDHGYPLGDFPEMVFDFMDLEAWNPVLMVKDFGATGFVTSDEFMTLADIPTLTMQGVIENPVNPYTGNPINSDAKTTEDVIITLSENWDTKKFRGITLDMTDAPLYKVHDNIFDVNNWEEVTDIPKK
ncbi:MAG: membrane protein insertase YidC [Lachnospiraceae bacterium]|nr:membrane protein insertase YidC [Lachnospiraceae bacterium]